MHYLYVCVGQRLEGNIPNVMFGLALVELWETTYFSFFSMDYFGGKKSFIEYN